MRQASALGGQTAARFLETHARRRPAPHAIAHNEQYRKLIKGTMLRHKVKPGITGGAQVNGLRGETETLDKMRARVQYDIDTMRNWSLGFDIMIIGKTLAVVWRDQNAY